MERNDTLQTPKYFFLLDIARGVAALSVVLFHWQHFYTYNGIQPASFDRTKQPLYSIFFMFYNAGGLSVDFFFLLSGFIFFFLYADKIRLKKVNGMDFSLLRFSRLYPLHFITLLLVALLQYFTVVHIGVPFVYTYNNVYHFLLNFFFIQSWGLEAGNSFNAPTWSVSVEVLLYLLFFLLCWYNLNKKHLRYLAVLAGLIISGFYPPIGRGIIAFFIGGILYYLYLNIIKNNYVKQWFNILICTALGLFLLMICESKTSYSVHLVLLIAHYFNFIHNDKTLTAIVNKTDNQLVRYICFPVFLMCMALHETIKGPVMKKLAFIGHISYSSYLLHFPLQIMLVNILFMLNKDQPHIFNSIFTLTSFFLTLIILSLISFYFFELPVQNYVRNKFGAHK